MESFTIFTSSAMVDHIILCYFTQQHFAKWLGKTCNYIWGTEIAFEIKKKNRNKISLMHEMFYITRQFYRFLHRGWDKFSSAK